MMRTVAHFMPFAAFAGGILDLLMPRLLNYVVAIYLILVGAIGLNSIYHFIRCRARVSGLANGEAGLSPLAALTEGSHRSLVCRFVVVHGLGARTCDGVSAEIRRLPT